MSDAIDRFNARFENLNSPEAIQHRASERAEYERRYELMMARRRVERFNAEFEYVLAAYFAPYWEIDS